MKRAVAVQIDQRMFLRFLGLPMDVRVLGWQHRYDGSITVGVEHESLPLVSEGETIPIKSLLYWREEGEAPANARIARLSAAWDFAPEKRWPIRIELIEPLPEAPDAA